MKMNASNLVMNAEFFEKIKSFASSVKSAYFNSDIQNVGVYILQPVLVTAFDISPMNYGFCVRPHRLVG